MCVRDSQGSVGHFSNAGFGQHGEAGNMESVQKSAVDNVFPTRLQGRIRGILYHRHSTFSGSVTFCRDVVDSVRCPERCPTHAASSVPPLERWCHLTQWVLNSRSPG